MRERCQDNAASVETVKASIPARTHRLLLLHRVSITRDNNEDAFCWNSCFVLAKRLGRSCNPEVSNVIKCSQQQNLVSSNDPFAISHLVRISAADSTHVSANWCRVAPATMEDTSRPSRASDFFNLCGMDALTHGTLHPSIVTFILPAPNTQMTVVATSILAETATPRTHQ